jgi:hypothetical protein
MMRALKNFFRGLLGVIVVLSMILVVVSLGWAAGVWISGALDVAPTAPVIVCMLVPLIALGLWLESSRSLGWFSSKD